MRSFRGLVPFAMALSLAAPAAAAPEDPGPLAVASSTVMVPVGGGAELSTDLYVPKTGGACPTVVLRHGFLRSKQNFVNWGMHLGSRGFVVLAPTSRAPAAPNPALDSDDMIAVLSWAVAQGSWAGSPLQGRVDASRLAVAGHSAGGLAAALAASKGPSVRAAVLLDPVDVPGGPGAAGAPATKVPVAALFCEPGLCNGQGNYLPVFPTFGGARYGLKVLGAGHCAPEDPSDILCDVACGGAPTVDQRAAYRRYATAFLEAFLRCDPAAFPYIDGAAAKADKAITIFAQNQGLTWPPPICSGLADQPSSRDAAAARDASADRSVALDGNVSPREAGAPPAGAGEGCGCEVARGSLPSFAPGLLLALTCTVAATRRKTRRRCTACPRSSARRR